jgi:hypothetical protein
MPPLSFETRTEKKKLLVYGRRALLHETAFSQVTVDIRQAIHLPCDNVQQTGTGRTNESLVWKQCRGWQPWGHPPLAPHVCNHWGNSATAGRGSARQCINWRQAGQQCHTSTTPHMHVFIHVCTHGTTLLVKPSSSISQLIRDDLDLHRSLTCGVVVYLIYTICMPRSFIYVY